MLEVLTVVDWVEVEVLVGYESRCTPPRLSSLSIGHSTNGFEVCCLTEADGMSTSVSCPLTDCRAGGQHGLGMAT